MFKSAIVDDYVIMMVASRAKWSGLLFLGAIFIAFIASGVLNWPVNQTSNYIGFQGGMKAVKPSTTWIGIHDLQNASVASVFGENINNYLGRDIAGVGDVDADGHDDILVGTTVGKSYLLYGPIRNGKEVGITSVANVSFTGERSNDRSGRSVAAAGDVNGDGYADFLIGAYGFNSNQGKVYLLYGPVKTGVNVNISTVANASFLGESIESYTGYSLSGAGDVNGDGYDDILIGAPQYPNLQGSGKSYLIFGNGSGNEPRGNYNVLDIAAASFTGEYDFDRSGNAVKVVGDVNGDGLADILIAAPAFYDEFEMGRAYLIYGRDVTTPLGGNYPFGTMANATFTGDTGSFAVSTLSGAGDMNGDGLIDFLIGTLDSKAFLFYGRKNGNTLVGAFSLSSGADATFTHPFSTLQGCAVAGGVDFNADGYDDVMIGGAGYPAGINRGKTYLVYGAPVHRQWVGLQALETVANATFEGRNDGDYVGSTLAAGGDIDADGCGDFLIGAIEYPSGFKFGCAYVLLGGGVFQFALPVPADITYTTGSTENRIRWRITGPASIPRYSVYLDGSVLPPHDNLVWAPRFEIIVQVDGLAVGIHNLTIVGYNGEGAEIHDVVFISVTAPDSPPAEISGPACVLIIGMSCGGVAWGIMRTRRYSEK